MAKSSSEYWEKRIASKTWKTYNSLEDRNRELLDFYTDASEAVKQELYDIAEKHSKDGVLTLSDMHKQNRLTELNKKYEQIALDLGKRTEKSASGNMKDGFIEVYRNTAVGMGDEDFSMPNKKLMNKLLNEPWRGDSFSSRLWKKQKKLAVGLNDILLTGLQQGKTVTEMAVSLHNFVGNCFNDCHRLVRTETMHYLNSATLQRYKDSGVEYVQILAASDERTCDICGVGGYHGKVYPIDKCPVLPFHANCRCTIIPCFDDELLKEYEKQYILKETTDKWSKEARLELFRDEDSISGRNNEIASVYTPDGKFLFQRVGTQGEVSFKAQEILKLKGSVITHNHPTGASLSVQDIITLKRSQAAEIRVSTEECTYYIRHPKTWSAEISKDSELVKAIKDIEQEIRGKYRTMYRQGKISKVERHRLFRDEVNQSFSERYGFDYGREYR